MARWTHVGKLGTSNFAYELRMSKSGFGLLTCCIDDPKIVAVCRLGFTWRILIRTTHEEYLRVFNVVQNFRIWLENAYSWFQNRDLSPKWAAWSTTPPKRYNLQETRHTTHRSLKSFFSQLTLKFNFTYSSPNPSKSYALQCFSVGQKSLPHCRSTKVALHSWLRSFYQTLLKLRRGARNGITELSLLVIFNRGRHLYFKSGRHVGHRSTF